MKFAIWHLMSMSTFPFLVILAISSSCLCFMVNSWFLIWVMLELNTLAFCSLLKTFTKKKKGNSEAAMKYFIIQSNASILLVFSTLSMKTLFSWNSLLMLAASLALMIKTGASPFHQWFINMVKKISISPSFMLMTWQKLAPVYLMMYQSKKMIYPFIILSGVVGTMSQMNKTATMEILAFSSLFNLSWMIIGLIMNITLLLVFCASYWLSVIIAMILFNIMKMKEGTSFDNNKTPKGMVMLAMISLGGVPPTSGFISKWIVFNETIKHSLISMNMFLLIISSMNLYLYLRMNVNYMSKHMKKASGVMSKSNKILMSVTTLLNTIPFLMMVV